MGEDLKVAGACLDLVADLVDNEFEGDGSGLLEDGVDENKKADKPKNRVKRFGDFDDLEDVFHGVNKIL